MLITLLNAAGVEMLVPKNKIALVLKKQLDSRFVVITPNGVGIPCMYGGDFVDFQKVKETLEDLHEFETVSGDVALVNPQHLLVFEKTDALGVYNLMLSANFAVGLKTTKSDLERLVENGA